ncbi:MAG: hypothetical protein EXS14_08885 [Planctomycetes bacterium]|nr:hypothetical protein [Planctomycetota bacterium]
MRGALWLILLLGIAPAERRTTAILWGGDAAPLGCGVVGCSVHLRTQRPCAGCLTGGVRLLLEDDTEVCCAADSLHLQHGTFRVSSPRRIELRAGTLPKIVLHGAARLKLERGTVQLLITAGFAQIGGRVQAAGIALEGDELTGLQVVCWPRGLCQEAEDVFSWPSPVTLCGPRSFDPTWPATERWLLARMLENASTLPPLQRTAVLLLVLERGSPGLQVACMQMMTASEVAWLSDVLRPMQSASHERVRCSAEDALRWAGPFALPKPNRPTATQDWDWWLASRVPAMSAARRAALRFVEQPWLYDQAELRGAIEEALDTDDFDGPVPKQLHQQMPCDLSVRDVRLRLLEGRRRALLQAAEAQLLDAAARGDEPLQLGALHTRHAARLLQAQYGVQWMHALAQPSGHSKAPPLRNPPALDLGLPGLLHLWVAPGADAFAP